MKLPTWEECQQAVKTGSDTSLQRFIYDNDPAGPDSAEFLDGLSAILSPLIEKLQEAREAADYISKRGVADFQDSIDELLKQYEP